MDCLVTFVSFVFYPYASVPLREIRACSPPAQHCHAAGRFLPAGVVLTTFRRPPHWPTSSVPRLHKMHNVHTEFQSQIIAGQLLPEKFAFRRNVAAHT